MGRRDDVIPKGADDTAITVWLSPASKQRLKVVAAGAGLSMASFVRRMIERATEAEGSGAQPLATGEARNPRKSRREA